MLLLTWFRVRIIFRSKSLSPAQVTMQNSGSSMLLQSKIIFKYYILRTITLSSTRKT